MLVCLSRHLQGMTGHLKVGIKYMQLFVTIVKTGGNDRGCTNYLVLIRRDQTVASPLHTWSIPFQPESIRQNPHRGEFRAHQ